jgi:ABC-2 type transport system permease protein
MVHNRYLRAHKAGVIVQWLTTLLWYGGWTVGAVMTALVVRGPATLGMLQRGLAPVLFFILFFWQMFPMLLASQGAQLDLRRLLAFPISNADLFRLEFVLRVTTSLEMLLITAGLMVGTALHRELPWYSPVAVLIFILFNLLLSTGIKSLIERVFRRRGPREWLMLVFLAILVLPQILAARLEGMEESSFDFLRPLAPLTRMFPWSATADLALGRSVPIAIALIAAWCAAAYLFARAQFQRTIASEDEGEAAPGAAGEHGTPWLDAITAWTRHVLPDPLAVLIEKDLRTLFRAPRFRLIFLMSATFGAVLWMPKALSEKESWLGTNYVTAAVLYGMLLLGEVIYWNFFGYERAGAQVWFAAPVPFRSVVHAKNLVAVLFTVLIVVALSIVSLLLPLHVSASQIADAFFAAVVFLSFLLGAGNLTSVHMPRPVDPNQMWRNSGGKPAFLLLIIYPLGSLPVGLAYYARWASGNHAVYYAVLAISLLIGLAFHAAATESAAEAGERRKEEIVAALVKNEGPIDLSIT